MNGRINDGRSPITAKLDSSLDQQHNITDTSHFTYHRPEERALRTPMCSYHRNSNYQRMRPPIERLLHWKNSPTRSTANGVGIYHSPTRVLIMPSEHSEMYYQPQDVSHRPTVRMYHVQGWQRGLAERQRWLITTPIIRLHNLQGCGAITTTTIGMYNLQGCITIRHGR